MSAARGRRLTAALALLTIVSALYGAISESWSQLPARATGRRRSSLEQATPQQQLLRSLAAPAAAASGYGGLGSDHQLFLEWLEMVGDPAFNVPGPGAGATRAMLAALAQLLSPSAAAEQQLAAMRRMSGLLRDLQAPYLASTRPQPRSTAALRRLCTAALFHASDAKNGSAGVGWSPEQRLAYQELLLQWLSLHLHSAAGRPIEFTHISKTAGTTMCKLAVKAGCTNPWSDIGNNCMLPAFGDTPVWTRPVTVQHLCDGRPGAAAPGMCSYQLKPPCAYDCPAHHNGSEELDCYTRAFSLQNQRIKFYSQERQLHGGSRDDPAASAACPNLLSVVSVRPALPHAVSLVLQVQQVYEEHINRAPSLLRTFQLPANLSFWQQLAPAVLDNYVTRSLLGRAFMCLPFGGVTAGHARHAASKLLAFDAIIDLEQGRRQQDQITRLGLGWNVSLADAHERKGTRRIERIGLRADAVLPLLEQWSQHDQQVYSHGSAMARLDARFFAAAAQLVRQHTAEAPAPSAGPPGSGQVPQLRHLEAGRLAQMAAILAAPKSCGFITQ